MWICSKCETYNDEAEYSCFVCNTIRELPKKNNEELKNKIVNFDDISKKNTNNIEKSSFLSKNNFSDNVTNIEESKYISNINYNEKRKKLSKILIVSNIILIILNIVGRNLLFK